MHRYYTTAIFVSACVVLLSGCQTMQPNTAAGSALGAMTGGLIGASIGSHDGKTGEGAILGAIAGGIGGAAIGNQVDYQEQQWQQQQNAQAIRAQQAAVTLEQVTQMSQKGLSDELIVNQIHANGMSRRPSTDDLIRLKSSGVSDRVIQEMQTMSQPAYSSGNFQPPRFSATFGVEPYCSAPPVIFHGHHHPHDYYHPY